MTRENQRQARNGALGLTVLAAALWLPGSAAAGQAPAAAPTFSKDVAPIFQAKCEACHRPDSIAPMSLVTYQQARPWARSIKARVLEHQMPPFQIDRTVGVTKFKNDESLSDGELQTIVKWVDAGAPQGDPKELPPAREWPSDQGWNFAKIFGQAEPDLVVKSESFTMPAVAQDAWDERVTPSGITEPRWVRAIEIRPNAVKGRKITHHAIAYLQQDEPGVVTTPGLPVPFMEWAVGKQGELMRPDTGKLLLPGSKFRWDIHYSQAGEEITSNVEMGIYFYPKGQEPKYRNSLSLVPAALGTLDIRPNAITVSEGFFPLKDNARIESFQPHMHLRGKAMMVEAVLPSGQRQVLSNVERLQLHVDDHLRLRRRRGAAAAQGHAAQGHRVARQHHRQEEQSRSEPVGRLGRPDGRRDGPCLDQHRLHEGRRVQGRGREAQERRGHDFGARPAVEPPAPAHDSAFRTDGVRW